MRVGPKGEAAEGRFRSLDQRGYSRGAVTDSSNSDLRKVWFRGFARPMLVAEMKSIACDLLDNYAGGYSVHGSDHANKFYVLFVKADEAGEFCAAHRADTTLVVDGDEVKIRIRRERWPADEWAKMQGSDTGLQCLTLGKRFNQRLDNLPNGLTVHLWCVQERFWAETLSRRE